jgi:RHS repeat-associated protein
VGSYRYGYQGEFAEKDSETDWNSFELRQYDSDVARWLSVDPYQQYWSPYVAMGNDPTNQIDPDGGLSGGTKNNDPPEGWGNGIMLDEVTVYSPLSFSYMFNNPSAVFWDFMRSGDSYANGNENSIFANIGRFSFDAIPFGSGTNAIYGATTGQNIFGESMGTGGVFMAGIGAIPGFGGFKVGKGILSRTYRLFAGEKYYRAMSNVEYLALVENKGLTYLPGKELFVSSSASYSRAYLQKSSYDVLVEFRMRFGATDYFNSISVFHRTAAASSGWASRGNLLWKSEKGVMNLGIQQNTDLFNPWITLPYYFLST